MHYNHIDLASEYKGDIERITKMAHRINAGQTDITLGLAGIDYTHDKQLIEATKRAVVTELERRIELGREKLRELGIEF